jgi:hypothetical protein
VITAKESKAGLLTVRVDLRDDGMLLNIGDVPAGATLECELDNEPLVPCHDGAIFVRPPEGEHIVKATAFKDGFKQAVGASNKFRVLPGTGGAFDDNNNPRDPLTLVNDDQAFVDLMAVPLTKDIKLKFRFANKKQPAGCKTKIKCQYDSRQSSFWTDCDDGDRTYTVDKQIMAVGLQSFSAQASCGDDLGPILTISWFGVPAGYKPLMLRAVKDQKKRYFINLVKSNDCGSSQVYECAEPNDTDFALCPTGNTLDNPPSGYQVRIVCEGKAGPILKL